ncbi:hypothetical protein ACVWYN_003098 [Pedobacter sp. UYP24]
MSWLKNIKDVSFNSKNDKILSGHLTSLSINEETSGFS